MNKLARMPAKRRARRAPASDLQHARRHTRYFAFLSYSHKDQDVAEWLHSQLEQFRVPRNLVGQLTENGVIPKRLRPIFRDQHELAAADDLGEEIEEALANSRFMIVVCSPDAAKSKWTNAEIDTFKRIHPDGSIIAAVVAGEPLASDIPGHEQEECFPPALVAKYNRRGRPTGQKTEPLAADLREGKGGRRVGFLKIVAGMLGVGLDELVQRETTRRQRRLALLAAASLGGMAVTSTLAVTAIQARDEAREQRRQAEGLVGFMLGDLKDKLEPIGRLDALDAVGSRALAYYQRQDKGSLPDEALAQRARALTLMGEIANTRGDLDGALSRYQEALASTTEEVRRYPSDPQRLFDHAQNVYWVGYIAYQRGQLDDAAARFRQYKRLAEAMVALAPDKTEYRLEEVSASTSLGAVFNDQGRYRESAASFQSSLGVAESLAASDPRNDDYQKSVVNLLAWLADAHEFSGALDQALAERERQVELLTELQRRNPQDSENQRDLMTARRSIGRLLASRGDVARGLKELLASVAISDNLFRIEPDNTEWLQANASGRFDLADLQLSSGQRVAGAATTRSACDIVDRLLQRDKSVANWKVDLQATCLNLRARIALANGNSSEALALAKQSSVLARTSPNAVAGSILAFRALAIGGNALAAAGDKNKAAGWWGAAVKAMPRTIQLRPREQADLAAVELQLGNRAEAQRLFSSLSAMGYRYPGTRPA